MPARYPGNRIAKGASVIDQKLVRGVILLGSLVLAACGGGGSSGGDDGPAVPAPIDGLATITLPDFPHSIDVYGVSNADKAVVILHGAAGHNYGLAHDLGLNSNEGPPTANSVDFTRLRARKILAVFPQGQAFSNNAYSWDNHVMVSGEDDVAFLKALVSYIKTEYGISRVYLMGHSNGGMMANRFWCESPTTFDGYIAVAGPASVYYSNHPCTPAVARPYYGIVGDQDPVLRVNSNWDAATWTIAPLIVAAAADAFVDPELIGEWQLHKRHADLGCGATPTLAQRIRSGNVDTWLDCNGSLKVQRIFTAEHNIASIEAAAGFSVFDEAADFIDGLN
jgi:polyhydroxybutyrate depolymerase